MKFVPPTDRELRDLDREIGFAPPIERKQPLYMRIANILGFIILGLVLFLLTIVTIHVLFYLMQ